MPVTKIQQVTPQRYVGIWHIEENESLLRRKLGTISEQDRKVLNGFKFEANRLEWLATRLTIRELSRKMNIGYQCIAKDENGKPLLSGAKAEVSISHSYPYACAIIDESTEVGIDLEQPKETLRKVARKFMSDSEIAFCQDNPDMLCIVWSAKETLYKIHSKRGLSFKTQLAVVPFEPGVAGSVDAIIDMGSYRRTLKLHYEITAGYVLVYNKN